MPFCTACGNQNPDDARFCSHCGTKLVSAPAVEPIDSTATITFGGRETTRPLIASWIPSTPRPWMRFLLVTRCSWFSEVRGRVAGSSWTRIWCWPDDILRARSSSTM